MSNEENKKCPQKSEYAQLYVTYEFYLMFYGVTYYPFQMSAKHNVELKFSRSSKLGPIEN